MDLSGGLNASMNEGGRNHIFSPAYLNLPALPPHLTVVILSAIFYQIVYSVFGPLIFRLFSTKEQNVQLDRVPYHFFNIQIVSIAQSFINTALAIYLLVHTEFRSGLTAQEMILGYHQETAIALAVSLGYFVFHFGACWVYRDIHGYFMFWHGVAALFAVSLGFRPLSLHYSAIFLIWELPNLFLNFQRMFDRAGKNKTKIRAVNRQLLLSTYVVFRLGLGTIFLLRMANDIIITIQDMHPILRVASIVPSGLRVGGYVAQHQEVGRVPAWLAFFQLGSMVFLHLQGFYWFAKIAMKGDLRKG